MDLTVVDVERTWVELPFREVPGRHMIRELPHWTLFEICTVKLACGVSGFGETMCYYTWGNVTDETVAKTRGKNAAESMWDDSLGAGLQMALFDAVGKVLQVPCYRLLGSKVRTQAYVGWWAIDMPAEDWLREGRTALDLGYTSLKIKARPWFDLQDQCARLHEQLPAWFELDLDFNGMLRETARASQVLAALERHSSVAIYESPIPQENVAGTKHLRNMVHVPLALHYGSPPIITALRQDICDGFVVGGGASRVLQQAATLSEAHKIFWLQLVGTGITATWALHLAAVLSHARWPAVNCFQLYTTQLIRPTLTLSNGLAAVPDVPGLGVSLDEEAVEQYRTEPKDKPYPRPGLLLEIQWPSGARSYYTHTKQYWDDFLSSKLPVFMPGVNLAHIPNDGSSEWQDLYRRAEREGVHSGATPSGLKLG